MYNPITTLERPTNEWLGIVSRMKFQDEADYRKLLSRLRRLPVQVSISGAENLRRVNCVQVLYIFTAAVGRGNCEQAYAIA